MKSLSLATVFAAISGFVVVIVAARALDAETEARYFQAYWGLFFAATGLIDGITQETTRAVASARESRSTSGSSSSATPHHPQLARPANPWRFGAIVAVVIAVVVVVGGVLAMDRVVPMSHGFATGLLVFGLVSYIFQAVLSGILSGMNLWPQYASLVALDSGVRLVLAVVAWWAGWGIGAFLVITVIGAASWAVILGLSGAVRSSISATVHDSRGAFARRALQAMVASGATAALITGYPTFLNAAFPEEDPTTVVTIAGIIYAVTLTRAPILVPLQRFQSMLVVTFVEAGPRIYRALVKPIAAVLALGVIGFLAAWAVGSWIMVTILGPDYLVPGVVLGVLTFASALTGSLMITGTAVLALDQHAWYVAGWITAGVVAYAILFAAPLGLVAAVCTSLIVGPLAGALVHLAGLMRARQAPRAHHA